MHPLGLVNRCLSSDAFMTFVFILCSTTDSAFSLLSAPFFFLSDPW